MNQTYLNKQNIRQLNLRKYILVALCFLSAEPWFIWQFREIIIVLSLLYIVIRLSTKFKYHHYLLLPILISFYMMIPKSNSSDSFGAIIFISMIFLSLFLTEEDSLKADVFKTFRTIFAVLILFGIIFYALHNFIKLPYLIIESRNTLLVHQYKNYIFFVEAINDPDVLPRFRFIFDEAGVVGSLCFIILLMDKFRIKDWKSIIILLGGIISFSLFFYVASIITLILLSINNIKRLLLIIFIGMISFFILTEIPKFNNLILTRLVITDNGFSGDNRTSEEFDYQYGKFLKSNYALFGKGLGSIKEISKIDLGVSATYKQIIYENGIFGFFLIVFVYFTLINKKLRFWDSIIIIIAFIMYIYQRPWFYQNFLNILFFSGIINFKLKNQIKLFK